MVARGRRPGSVTASGLSRGDQVTFVQLYALTRGSLDGIRGLIAAVGASSCHFIQDGKVREQGLRVGSRTGSGESWWLQR